MVGPPSPLSDPSPPPMAGPPTPTGSHCEYGPDGDDPLPPLPSGAASSSLHPAASAGPDFTVFDPSAAFSGYVFAFKRQIEKRGSASKYIWRCTCPFHWEFIGKRKLQCGKAISFNSLEESDLVLRRPKSSALAGRTNSHRAHPKATSHVHMSWRDIVIHDDATLEELLANA